jgi:A nuclease family of the HNH/ENDO VII superfamily with conserved AHH
LLFKFHALDIPTDEGGTDMSLGNFAGNQQPGYQRHHLIPVNIVQSYAFAKLFSFIAPAGFKPHCFLNNGHLLPATEVESVKTGLPLHRGPHRQYDDLIAECLNMIWLAALAGHIPATPVSLMTQISDLQGLLRRILGPSASIKLNQHDPRGVQSHLSSLDHDLKQMNHVHLLA